MKKIKSLLSVVCALVLATTMLGCPGPNGPDGPTVKEFSPDGLDLNAKSPASSWAFVTYGLDEFAGKEVTIDLSCDVEYDSKEENPVNFKWQVNDGSTYPEVVTFDVPKGADTLKVSGKNASPIKIAGGNVLYLSTNNATYDITMKITNIKYTISYAGADEPAKPAKEYPTDIFTVGEAGTCGIQIGDGAIVPFTAALQFDAPNASDIKYNADGSVTYIAKAAGGAGGSVAFYFDAVKTQINSGNYESVDVEFVASPVTGKWANEDCKPSVALRLLPYDSTGVFGGFEDVEYFGMTEDYGTLKYTVKIPEDFAAKIIDSSLFDCIKAFTLKFNDYNQGLNDGDSMMIQIKKIKLNKKAGAGADEPYVSLPAAEKGTVKSINYPTKDYAAIAAGEEGESYEKHAWVYLPAGYDAADTETKYPVFVLLHGFNQNENTWGLNDTTDGKIKTYMDYFMKDGTYEKFILVCATGVASKNWGPDGAGSDMNGFNAFGGELRNDLLPYIYANFNCLEGRENAALAGLSMGASQTLNIGMLTCLDLFSYYGAFSFTFPTYEDSEGWFGPTPGVKTQIEANHFEEYDIKYLYTICGDNDAVASWNVYEAGAKDLADKWDKLTLGENFSYEKYLGGTHDFPVWYRGFKHFGAIVFKK